MLSFRVCGFRVLVFVVPRVREATLLACLFATTSALSPAADDCVNGGLDIPMGYVQFEAGRP